MKAIGILGVLILTTAVSPGILAAQAVSARSASRIGQPKNRWRYAWHNDRWWYWTPSEHWSYFDGRRWQSYDPRRPLSGAQSAGYRKAPAFESPPAAPPQPPRTWSAEGVEREAGLTDSYLEGGQPLPSFGSPMVAPSGVHASERMESAAAKSAPSAGSGAFGGPKGSSLGAGSAAGGASSPQ